MSVKRTFRMNRSPRAAGIIGLLAAACLGLAACSLSGPLAGDKAITAFGFEAPAAAGTIVEASHRIAVSLPYGTDLSALSPTIVITGASVEPASGTPQDFRGPVVYTVKAQDGGVQNYTVTCSLFAYQEIDRAFWGQWKSYGPQSDWYFSRDEVRVMGLKSAHTAASATSITLTGGPASLPVGFTAPPEGPPVFLGGTLTKESDTRIRFDVSGRTVPYYLYRVSGPDSGFTLKVTNSASASSAAGLRATVQNANNPGDTREAVVATDGTLSVAGAIIGDYYRVSFPVQAGLSAPVASTVNPAFDGQEAGSIDLAQPGLKIYVSMNGYDGPCYADGTTAHSVTVILSNLGTAELSGLSYGISGEAGLTLSGAVSGSLPPIPASSAGSAMIGVACAPTTEAYAVKRLTVQATAPDGRSWTETLSLRFPKAAGTFTVYASAPQGQDSPRGILIDPDGISTSLGSRTKLAWKAGTYNLVFAGAGSSGKTKYGVGIDVPAPIDFKCLTSTAYGLPPSSPAAPVEPANDRQSGATVLPYRGTALQYMDANDVDCYRFELPLGILDLAANISPGIYWGAQNVTSLTSSLSGVSIRYTKDFSEPSETHGTLWTGPVAVAANEGFFAYAYKDGYWPKLLRVVDRSRMVSVPAGSFDNGTGAVNLSAFKISNAEVTIEEYRLFDPGFPDNLLTSDLSSPLPDAVHQPVMYVNWYRALMYCNARSIAEGLTPVYRLMIFGSDPPAYSTDPAVWKVDIDHNGSPDEPYSGNIEILGPIWNAPLVDPAANGYRLPTEAQWEYAARSGSPAESYLYAGSDTRDEAAWYYGNATFLGRVVTHLPGLKKPNRLGLYDMSGNVEEWCWDWAGPYVSSPRTDPAGATAGTERAVRGGAYRYEGQEVAARASARPYYEDHARGIRLVRMNAE